MSTRSLFFLIETCPLRLARQARAAPPPPTACFYRPDLSNPLCWSLLLTQCGERQPSCHSEPRDFARCDVDLCLIIFAVLRTKLAESRGPPLHGMWQMGTWTLQLSG